MISAFCLRYCFSSPTLFSIYLFSILLRSFSISNASSCSLVLLRMFWVLCSHLVRIKENFDYYRSVPSECWAACRSWEMTSSSFLWQTLLPVSQSISPWALSLKVTLDLLYLYFVLNTILSSWDLTHYSTEMNLEQIPCHSFSLYPLLQS